MLLKFNTKIRKLQFYSFVYIDVEIADMQRFVYRYRYYVYEECRHTNRYFMPQMKCLFRLSSDAEPEINVYISTVYFETKGILIK